MALSSPDPIMTTFELRQEMMKLAEIEKEFKVSNIENINVVLHLLTYNYIRVISEKNKAYHLKKLTKNKL